MTFTFTNYAGIPAQQLQSPFHDMIGQLLGGYEAGTKAQFLRPGLEEQLKKAQLVNKYYGPNIESQIGLRGAQAGHANSLTTGQNITNRYLEPQLRAQLEALRYGAQEKKYFNDLIRQRVSGQQQQIPGQLDQQQIPIPEYQAGGGQAPYMEQQNPAIEQTQSSQPQFSSGIAQQGPPQLSDEDILNKHLFKIDTFTPKYKAYIDSQTKNMQKKEAEKFKLDAKKDYDIFKEVEKARTDLPVLQNALQSALMMKEIIEKRPAFWGHYLAPGLFSKTATDELAGVFQSKLVPQLASMESQLSQRGNQLALKISESKLPSFSDSQKVALGKANGLINEIQKRLGTTKDLAGGDVRKIGSKRYKFIDGKWFELEKGD